MKKYDTEYYRVAKVRQRARALALVGDCCAYCGATEELQFDHVDPTKKSFNVNKRLSIRNPEVLEELKKCQLLCRTCHEHKSAEEQRGFTHGTLYGWQKAGCECAVCSQAKAEWALARNARRRAAAPTGRGPYQKIPGHGTTTMYRKGCRCQECYGAVVAWRRTKS